MRNALMLLLVVSACGGPSQQQLAETPSANTRSRPTQAPPASSSDNDRARLNQQFEDMQTTQNAYREAGEGSAAPTPPPGAPGAVPPKKKGPAEQAPPEPAPKKKGPAVQAPSD